MPAKIVDDPGTNRIGQLERPGALVVNDVHRSARERCRFQAFGKVFVSPAAPYRASRFSR